MKPRRILRASLFSLVISTVLLSSLFAGSAQTDESADNARTTEQATSGAKQLTPTNLPKEIDVRGPHGVPKGLRLLKPNQWQLAAISALKTAVRSNLQIQYNALTATPRHMYSHGKYLSAPSRAEPETIARDFISKWRAIFRFTQSDIDGLRLKSRAKIPDMGTTVLLFEQTKNGLPVYQGEVLVNVNRTGQIMSIGGESFPQMTAPNVFTLTYAQALSKAATALGITGFRPVSKGTKKVLNTFGDLPYQYLQGQRFGGGGKFSDEIVATKVIFPLGSEGRPAYHFTLTTPQYKGIMWNHIVDAQTGAILRRSSLTSFYGDPGGGPNNNRRSTFRPDVQDLVESYNPAGTAAGKVYDSVPTAMSGAGGFGRPARNQLPKQPNYAADNVTTPAANRGFRQIWVKVRNEDPYADVGQSLFAQIFNTPFGQVTRGLPDASNPTPQSPFGWFYLPTGNNGGEITTDNPNRATTRAYGYTIDSEAQSRNLAANSPVANKSQPYSATITNLPGGNVITQDGRTLSSVIESNYTEGNNVIVADDHANDDETTHGIKGYDPNRQFLDSYFDYTMNYEFVGPDAVEGDPIPASANPDVYPGTTTLFYYNNIMHDYLYSLGFTEALWNFQQDNFGKGGAGRDGVSAQVQDGSGVDNANFGTPADGSNPRMQMYLFTDGGFRRTDGDFDFDVVAHEHYHGVSNRSVGKGTADCLGVALVGESGGMGEGWSDYIACSMTDDDAEGEYATGQFDIGIRHLPYTNFRYSYGAINGSPRRRDQMPPGTGEQIFIPFEVHDVGEMWAATLWDMRELMIVKQNSQAIFFDGTRRLGTGTAFFIGTRQVQSTDTQHPINYRAAYNTGSPATIIPANHAKRPNAVATEIQTDGNRNGPLATSVRVGARLADTITLRGMQIAPCHPSFVDMRDSMLMADTELTGGENRAIIWRAFASHGVGVLAASTSTGEDPGSQNAPVIVEDFSVPADVTACETSGPLGPPTFTLSNPSNNTARVTITAPPTGITPTSRYIISRGDSASGPFIKVADIPSSQTIYNDPGLPGQRTYFYQVRTSRNPECVGTPNTDSVLVAGDAVTPAPLFSGVDRVDDLHDGSRLLLSWGPAVSLNPTPNIVYDIYRVNHVNHGTGQDEPTFTPNASNKIATVTGISYVDTGLALAHVYYYIVQARDTTNGKIDTNNTGNSQTRYNAPTIPQVKPNPPFALEDFENASASNRFTPPLTESGNNPDQASATFQRITVADLGVPSVGKMYAPDFSPGHELDGCANDPAGTKCGAQSDFYTQIGPFNGTGNPALTETSIMEFDNFINAEATFDGGNIEVKVGAPFVQGDATPFPDNTTTFELADYIIEGQYNGKLDGGLPACPPDPAPCKGSALQGRRSYTGVKGVHRVRAVLHNFAPGGVHNPQGLPVYIRFRMTSDVASANSVDAGWIIDNLVINNLACRVNVAEAEAGATATASSTYVNGGYAPEGAIDGDRKGTDWGNNGGWNDSTRDTWPDTLQVEFNGSKTINEIRVYTLQNNVRNPVEPTLLTPADLYGIKDFDVQYWDEEDGWVTVLGGSVTGNDKAMRVFVFPDVTTTKIRVVVNEGRSHWSRIIEVEAFGC